MTRSLARLETELQLKRLIIAVGLSVLAASAAMANRDTDPTSSAAVGALFSSPLTASGLRPVTFQYDAYGNLTGVLGRTPTTVTYTPTDQYYGRPSTVTVGSATTRYAYDRLGNVTEIKRRLNPPAGSPYDLVTAFQYDAQGRLTRETRPDGGVTEYAYNPAGRVLTRKEKSVALAWGGRKVHYVVR